MALTERSAPFLLFIMGTNALKKKKKPLTPAISKSYLHQLLNPWQLLPDKKLRKLLAAQFRTEFINYVDGF